MQLPYEGQADLGGQGDHAPPALLKLVRKAGRHVRPQISQVMSTPLTNFWIRYCEVPTP